MSKIFILGAPRSGTTLISEFIINNFKVDFITNYDDVLYNSFGFINFSEYINSGHLPLGRRKRYDLKNDYIRLLPRPSEGFRILQDLFGVNFPYDYFPVLDSNYSSEKTDAFISKLTNTFVHKITGPYKINFLESIFKDSKYIIVERNSADVALSLNKVGFFKRHNFKEPWWKNNLAYHNDYIMKANNFEKSKFEVDVIKNIGRWEIKQLPQSKCLIIKYEDFLFNHLNCFEQIKAFCNLSLRKNKLIAPRDIMPSNKESSSKFQDVEINEYLPN